MKFVAACLFIVMFLGWGCQIRPSCRDGEVLLTPFGSSGACVAGHR